MRTGQKAIWFTRPIVAVMAAAAMLIMSVNVRAQQTQQNGQKGPFKMQVTSELVLVDITARDKKGNFVRGLTEKDFTILEDGKPQRIQHFDVENVDAVQQANVEQPSLLTSPPAAGGATSTATTPPADTGVALNSLKDRRMLILFFDLTSMQPEEVQRAVDAAENYVSKQMEPADLVAVASLGTNLTINQDFTTDRAALKKVLNGFTGVNAQGFEEGSTGTTEGTPDTGGSFTVDDTEYNIFNTDHRLEALRDIAEQLEPVKEKKSLIYFSSGMDRTGVENESELRATVNAAVKANLSIYTMDMRGLQAMVAGGEAQSASLRGVSAYSGQSTINALNSNFTTQETLVTMADDTGGKAFLDSNDFTQIFRQVQNDTETYYMVGYQSSNHARDGRYRRIMVRVDRPGVKLTYSKGYYAPADFQHTNRSDREQQLEEAMASPLAETDFPLFLSTGYFRLDDDRYFVPVSLAVPGWDIPVRQQKNKEQATLDVAGWIEDENQRPFRQIRDTIKLDTSAVEQLRKKNVQYDTGFVLPPGKYHLKFIVREDQTGEMASFETDLNIPDMKSEAMKVSSVVLSNQIQTTKKRNPDDPLLHDGKEIVPDVTHVFGAQQKLYIYYEVYKPGRAVAKTGGAGKKQDSKDDIRVLTDAAFYRADARAYESPVVEVKQLTAPQRQAAGIQLEVPLDKLKPGFYICQINVIDDAAERFAFPRLALLVR